MYIRGKYGKILEVQNIMLFPDGEITGNFYTL